MKPACSHPVILKNLCAVCGMKIDASSSSFSSLTVAGGSVMRLSVDEANRVQQSKTSTLQRSRKLALVLDIDHTMLHAVQVEGPTPPEGQRVHMSGDLHHLPIEEVHEGQKRHLVIKKRPFLDYFLQEANKLFQLSIYTAGTRRYAEAVVRVIDPKGVYISNRIVSRSDVPGGVAAALDKSLDRIFLNDASMAVVLDDREDVWRGPQQQQLLLVRPYEYFLPNNIASRSVGAVRGGQGHGEVNNAPGQRSSLTISNNSTSTTSNEEEEVMPIIALHHPYPGAVLGHAPRSSPQFCEADDQLQRSLLLLQKLHASFYPPANPSTSTDPSSTSKKSVSTELSSLKAMTLAYCGVGICLPSNIDDVRQLSPAKQTWFNMLRSLAEALGAKPAILVPSSTAAKIARGDYRNSNTSSSSSQGQQQWSQITHLLAIQAPPNSSGNTSNNSNTTSDTNKLWLLHVDWLFFCRWSLAKAEESPFQLLLASSSTTTSDNTNTDGDTTSKKRKATATEEAIEVDHGSLMVVDHNDREEVDGTNEEEAELRELQAAKRRRLQIAPVPPVTVDQDEIEESDDDTDSQNDDEYHDNGRLMNDSSDYLGDENDNVDDYVGEDDNGREEDEDTETPLPSQEDDQGANDSSDDSEDDFSMLESILLNRKNSG